MTTLPEARQAVNDYFIAEWGDTTKYVLANEQLNPEPVDEPWVRLVVINRVSNQETLGRETQRRFKRRASVIAQVFTPLYGGTYDSDVLCEKIKCMFEGRDLGSIWFLESDVRETGEDGSWFQMLVETEFTYEQIK